jgi:two-component system, NarL family, nitrate/nitrite response regulator NarL
MATPLFPAPVPANQPVTTVGRRLRAVVADDEPHMLDALIGIMELKAEVQVVATASNGIGAIRAAQRLKPDLVVLDVRMPMMGGLEAAGHIKRRLPDTKVLLVSADNDPELGLAALDCGADGFMWKGSFAQRCQAQLELMFREP